MTTASSVAPGPNKLLRCERGHADRAWHGHCIVCAQAEQRTNELAVLSFPVPTDRRKGDVGRSGRAAWGPSQEPVRGRGLGDIACVIHGRVRSGCGWKGATMPLHLPKHACFAC